MIQVKIVLFASLRELLGKPEVEIQLEGPLVLSELIGCLGKSEGDQWFNVLSAENVLVAVNHTMVDHQHLVVGDDEVAFFPPVTGG